jgi:hypothetical protein
MEYFSFHNTVETGQMLRDVIVQGASDNVKVLLDHAGFVDLPKTYGELAPEIMRKSM